MSGDLATRLADIFRELGVVSNEPPVYRVEPGRYVRVALAATLTGYSDKAIRRKIADGVWLEGSEWVRSPSGEILIDMEGYERWCKGR